MRPQENGPYFTFEGNEKMVIQLTKRFAKK